VTTDFIVGFPSETDKQFENLLNFYKKANFDFAFLSKYSPRPETPAAKFANQIPEQVKKSRFQKLNDLLIKTTAKNYAKLKGQILEVLVEKCVNKVCQGRSSEFFLVKFDGNEGLVGKIVSVKVIQPREVELMGEWRVY
jgi:tRNA-2-methylthio-N6-dimethylallyladenosine synthase